MVDADAPSVLSWLRRLPEQVPSWFWVPPAACCVVAFGLGLLLPEIDRSLAHRLPFLFTGGPDGARSLLSAITTSMISVTGLVFSITMVVLQLASSQFSPRVLRSFLRSRVTQLTLGVFLATFLYAVLLLRSVRGGPNTEPFVPQLGVTFAFVLVLASVAMFVQYIHHITRSIQVSSILRSISAETRHLVDSLADDGTGAPLPPATPRNAPGRLVESEQAGVLVRVEEGTLVDEASRCDTVLSLLVRVGDFVPQGMPLVTASTAARDLDQNRVRRALTQAQERTMEQDVAFGLRQLVDIAERALSPGVNDPTTAVQALDEIHDLLRRLAAAPNPAASVTDDEGQVRLVLRPFRFEDLLALGLDEIVHYGKDSVQVPPRVAAMLADLHSAARPEHRPAIEAYRDRVRSATSHPR